MNTSLSRRWWVILLFIDIALNIFVIIRVTLGLNPFSSLIMGFASTCFVVSQLHRRATSLWWALAFVLLTIGLIISLLHS